MNPGLSTGENVTGYNTWAGMNEANQIYHDTEWGIPVHDDYHMFEHLFLECMQCGLSWDLMLKKREIFRSCFAGFDFAVENQFYFHAIWSFEFSAHADSVRPVLSK